MRSLFIFVLFIHSATFSFSANARDKVGLVLSGGGAKGSAHIGVLKVLEANNIPVDYIVGTSIGSYVAGMYALGYEVEDIEKIMLGLPWDNGYSDTIPRESLSYINKQHRDVYNLALRLGYSDGEFKVPHGLLLGQSAYQVLQRSTGNVRSFGDFDNLAIPYRAVASDIATAKPVILHTGSINQAMKASAAVPGIVAAVEVDGQMLVDGGITNNMPVDVVKAMGADVVIAVDIGSPLIDKSELTSSVSVLSQLSNILTNNTSLQQKSLLSEKDILLRPAIEHLSTTDWSIMPKALELGEQEALSNLPALKKLSIDKDNYQAYQDTKRQKAKAWFDDIENPIIAIDIQNNSKVSNRTILQSFNVEVGQTLTKEQLDAGLARVYSLNKFEQVTAEFTDTAEGRVLKLNTMAKSWGPNYLDFGFNLKTDFSTRTITALNMSYLMTDVTENDGRWLNEIELGWETYIASEFYQPLNREQDLYSRVRLSYGHDKWEETQDREELTNELFNSILALGYNYSFKGIFELGAIVEKGSLSFENSKIDSVNSNTIATDNDNDDFNYDTFGAFVTFGYDTLDSINFPTDGNKLVIKAEWLNDKYSSTITNLEEDTAHRYSLDWRGAIDFKGHTFVGITSIVHIDNEADFSVHVTELGGFLNLSGYQEDALIGTDKVFAALVYQYDLGRDAVGASGLPIYLGASLETGNVWNVNTDVQYHELINSGSVYLGTDTSFGPAVFGLGFAEEGEYSIFLSVGKNW